MTKFIIAAMLCSSLCSAQVLKQDPHVNIEPSLENGFDQMYSGTEHLQYSVFAAGLGIVGTYLLSQQPGTLEAAIGWGVTSLGVSFYLQMKGYGRLRIGIMNVRNHHNYNANAANRNN